jgi:hypothetical protein
MESSLAVAGSADRPLPPGTTRADFCTGRFVISADVQTGDRRLLEILRDSTRQYLDVRHLSVRPVDAGEQHGDLADGLLSKADIDWVAVRAEPSRAESRLYAFVKKAPVRVTLVLGSHRIEGNVFLDNSATDPATFFLRASEKSSERFMAVGSATIASSAGIKDDVGLAIVNRSAVRLFSVVR